MRNFTAGVYWAALTTRRIGEGMRARRKGSIVKISTMYAVVAPRPQLYSRTNFVNPPGYNPPGYSPPGYSAANAALFALASSTASFGGPFGVRANAILPGPFCNVEEDGENSVPPDDPFLDRLKARTVLGRWGSPRELVGALLHLASDAWRVTTEQALVGDGGWTIV